MMEYRARTALSEEAIAPMLGKIVTDDESSLLVTGPARLFKPDGSLLAVYVPGALATELLEAAYPILHELRKLETTNRGLASGTRRFERYKGSPRTESKPVASAIVGAFDKGPSRIYCRLTAWTGREFDKFQQLVPLLDAIGATFQLYVPDRFTAQMRYVDQVKPEWVITGTPFTTVTVNNTYPTGVHKDKGDLDEGFSTLAVLRRGNYIGGRLTFPKYRIAVDMQHGDVLLMDAHEWHGNTALHCSECLAYPGQEAEVGVNLSGMCTVHDTERISIVSYFRTKMTQCGSLEEEQARRIAAAELDSADDDSSLLRETVTGAP
jgi:hypothetical protein